MPPRTPPSFRAFQSTPVQPYVCPSCWIKQNVHQTGTRATVRKTLNRQSYATTSMIAKVWRNDYKHRTQQIAQHTKRQYTSNASVASTTAINAPSTTPPHLRELHEQLQHLQDKASSYVDLSRLQLAMRSLESSHPVIRVAFLGIGISGLRAARKLAKVLLADELGEEADWEKSLMSGDEGKGILLKYGEPNQETGVQGSNTTLVQELRIPSPRLQRWNVEILVAGLNATGYTPSDPGEGVTELEESILVPPLTIPGAGGRVGFIRYPVHKALIVADGVSGMVEFGRLPALLASGKLISAALSMPPQASYILSRTEDHEHASAISIDLAAQALDLFRSSNANGAIYSEKWQQSRVGIVSSWMTAASQPSDEANGMPPVVDDLLDSVLSNTDVTVSSAEASVDTSLRALSVSDSKRVALQSAIASWSEEAHRDLQVNLNAALVTPTWRRTIWWRLFWRIDEVSISAGDVLRRGWLVEAEQNLAFVSGRVFEAGLAGIEQLKGESALATPGHESTGTSLLPETIERAIGDYKATQAENAPPRKSQTAVELLQVPLMLANVKEQSGLDALFDPPWPQTIHLARLQMLHYNVPAMHRKAQALMLTSVSTIGGSGALAGWLWVASGGVAFYEAGAIAALGLVYALRRLQKKWGVEREKFTNTAKEDARRVLADVEGRLKALVQTGGRTAVRAEDTNEWEEARAAVKACQKTRARIARADSKQP